MRLVAIFALFTISLIGDNRLQMAIDSAESGSLLELPAGDYRGNIVIDKPLIIDGKDRGAKIIGDGSGPLLRLGVHL